MNKAPYWQHVPTTTVSGGATWDGTISVPSVWIAPRKYRCRIGHEFEASPSEFDQRKVICWKCREEWEDAMFSAEEVREERVGFNGE